MPAVSVELILASLEKLVQMENAWQILSVSLVLLMYFVNVDKGNVQSERYVPMESALVFVF